MRLSDALKQKRADLLDRLEALAKSRGRRAGDDRRRAARGMSAWPGR
jgi:hypothetical protein